jgi:guanine nucleotide exchange factor VAV
VICEDGSGRSVSDFLCRNNSFLFLHAVVSNFELSESQLFRPEDLYLCQDIGKVFRTLSELSHTPKVSKAGIPGFPKKEKHLLKRLKSERGDYEALEQMYGEAGTEYVYDSFATKVRLRDQHDLYYNEDIYQTIFPPKQPRLSLADISFGGTKKSKRAAPIDELVTTEDKYLENLIMVRDVFREKLSLMSPQDKALIFHQLDDFILLHSDLLFGLKTPKKDDIGKVFLRHLPRISHLYGGYCVHLPMAVDHLNHITENHVALKKQLMECQELAQPSTFPLSSQLVLPFQRFLKYHLLLKEILKRTSDDHTDYVNLKLASDEMVKAGEFVNERKREHEEAEQQDSKDETAMRLILSVSSTIKLMRMENGLNLLDYGRLRKAGDIVSYTETGRVGDYAFLFDLMIVLCHRPKWLQHRYRFCEAIKIRDHFLEPPLQQHSSSSSQDVFVLRLFSRVDARRVTLTLVTRTQAEREAWFNALLTAMDTVNPSENSQQGHVIQLTTFADPMDCFQCGKLLRGRFFQGYRCLRCQACMHKTCLADCTCLEVGAPLKKTNSLMLPTALPDNLERSNSTLSLVTTDGGNRRHSQVQELQSNAIREQESLPLEQQPWFAGRLAVGTANDRLESLPVGTFLIRQRANGQFALMLKCPEKPKGVKSMKIDEAQEPESGHSVFYLSQARNFGSLAKLVSFYRYKDLTENFNYEALRGVTLRTPYKDI